MKEVCSHRETRWVFPRGVSIGRVSDDWNQASFQKGQAQRMSFANNRWLLVVGLWCAGLIGADAKDAGLPDPPGSPARQAATTLPQLPAPNSASNNAPPFASAPQERRSQELPAESTPQERRAPGGSPGSAPQERRPSQWIPGVRVARRSRSPPPAPTPFGRLFLLGGSPVHHSVFGRRGGRSTRGGSALRGPTPDRQLGAGGSQTGTCGSS